MRAVQSPGESGRDRDDRPIHPIEDRSHEQPFAENAVSDRRDHRPGPDPRLSGPPGRSCQATAALSRRVRWIVGRLHDPGRRGRDLPQGSKGLARSRTPERRCHLRRDLAAGVYESTLLMSVHSHKRVLELECQPNRLRSAPGSGKNGQRGDGLRNTTAEPCQTEIQKISISPLPLTGTRPIDSAVYASATTFRACGLRLTAPIRPLDSIRDAVLTVSPQRS